MWPLAANLARSSAQPAAEGQIIRTGRSVVFREDQLQTFAWKYLIPISLMNILATGIAKVVL